MWTDTVQRTNSFLYGDILSTLRLRTTELGEGLISILSNHYVSRPLYISNHLENTDTFEVVYKNNIPIPINAWRIMDNDFIDFQCVITDTAVALNRARTLYNIYVLSRIRGVDMYNGLAIIQGVLLACDEINSNGGLLGYTIFPKIYGYEYDQDYMTTVRSIMSTEKNAIFIGGSEFNLRDAIASVVENSECLFLYVGVTISSNCYKNIISVQTTANQIIENIMYTILSYQLPMITLVSTKDYYLNLLYTDHLKRMIDTTNLKIEGMLEYSTETEVMDKIMKLLPNGGLIITLLTTDDLRLLAMDLFNKKKNKHRIVIGIYFDDFYRKIEQIYLNNHILLGSAFPDLKSAAAIELTDKAQSYLDLISENFGFYGLNSPHMESSYVAVYLLNQLISIDKAFEVSKLLTRITEVLDIGPVNVKFSSSNAVIRRMFAGEFQNNVLVLLHGPTSPINPEYNPMYSVTPYLKSCSWMTNEKTERIILFIHECNLDNCYDEIYATITVNFLILKSQTLSIFETNDFVIRNFYGENLNELELQLKSFTEVPAMVMGCNSMECMQLIFKSCETCMNSIVFFLGQSTGDICRNNLFQIGGLSTSRFQEVFNFLVERKFKNVIIVYDKYLFI